MASIFLAYVEPKLFFSFAGKLSVKLNKKERIHGNPYSLLRSCGVVLGWVLKATVDRGSDPAGALCELPVSLARHRLP